MPKPSRISTVTERGQTSIPADLRQELHLRQGNRLLWEAVSESELKVSVLPEPAPRGARAMLGFARRFRETRTTSDWMKELREGEEP
jgi:bifunctional DNA-binding transcriptional regulator/antitoxin component of YhaV-PrlF toxin-antitoxin module